MNHGLQCDGTLNGLVALECEAFKDVMENENRMIISGHIFEYMEIGKRSFLVLFLFFFKKVKKLSNLPSQTGDNLSFVLMGLLVHVK